MKLKPFKIRTLSASHSREIQEWLFSLGYSWCDGSTDVDRLGEPFLFFEEDPARIKPTLTYGSRESFYEENDLPEAWFYDGKIHYEPKPQTLPEFKIKVKSPGHSKAIQEFVFSMGYSWSPPRKIDQEVRNLDYKYLYFKKSYKEDKPSLTATNDLRVFDSLKLPEMWFYGGKLRKEPSQLEPQPQTQPQSEFWTYRQVAEALFEGKKLQFLDPSKDWISINYLGLHVHHLDREYPYEVRVKPRICNGVELDPCLTEHPDTDYYYYPDPLHVDYYGSKLWAGDGDDIYWLELGFAYATRESAAKHGQAMGITK